MWLNGAFAIFCLFKAFSLTLPFGAACFISVAIALSVALPQAPGFVGVFHVAIETTLLLWGQDPTIAKGFALIFWGVSFVPVTLIGVGFAFVEDIDWRGLTRHWRNDTKREATYLNYRPPFRRRISTAPTIAGTNSKNQIGARASGVVER